MAPRGARCWHGRRLWCYAAACWNGATSPLRPDVFALGSRGRAARIRFSDGKHMVTLRRGRTSNIRVTCLRAAGRRIHSVYLVSAVRLPK